MIGEGNGTPLQYFCLENPMDGGAWWAAVHGVAEGWTRLSDFPFTFPFHALEKEMATHSSVLAWRIPGTGEPGGLPSMGSHSVGHDWSDLAAVTLMILMNPSTISIAFWFSSYNYDQVHYSKGPQCRPTISESWIKLWLVISQDWRFGGSPQNLQLFIHSKDSELEIWAWRREDQEE